MFTFPPLLLQVMYDASGVRLQAGRQAEVCTYTMLLMLRILYHDFATKLVLQQTFVTLSHS